MAWSSDSNTTVGTLTWTCVNNCTDDYEDLAGMHEQALENSHDYYQFHGPPAPYH